MKIAGRNKYGAKRKVVDGIGFDSTAEAMRYGELKMMLRAKLISDLSVHPGFTIFVRGEKVCVVELDFKYKRDGQWVFEDVKGKDTAMSRLKRKLVKAAHGVDVRLVK